MKSNSEYTSAYFEILDELDGDIPSRRDAFNYMLNSTAIVHHEVVASTFIPRLFNQRTYDTMKEASELTHRILCKVMQRYIDDPGYREIFDFDDRLKELILIPRGYDSILPFARIDIFLDEDDYSVRFCEFNGDGSAGMNEDREIVNSIKGSATLRTFMEGHSVQQSAIFEPWVDAFLDIYSTYVHKVENPRIAICDYLENGVVDEFDYFAGLFKARGFECKVCDVRSLAYNGKNLLDENGNVIDAIWRRCVTNDVLEFWDDSQALIEACKNESVALIGSFAGHIVHDKQIFDVLMNQKTLDFLTAEEIGFLEGAIPATDFLDEAYVDLDLIKDNKDEWIIKPSDHYGADEVYAGCEVSHGKWVELIDEYANGRAGISFIVQRFVHPFKTQTLPPDTQIDSLPDGAISDVPHLYNNLNGLYVFDGRFNGVFSRLGPHPTISKKNEGMTAATLWVDATVENGVGL